MYMECYRTIFLSGTEGGEVLYIYWQSLSLYASGAVALWYTLNVLLT